MTIDKYSELIKLCNKVSELQKTNPELFVENKDKPGEMWFTGEDSDGMVHPLYGELDEFACGEFINNKGGYSNFWYQSKQITAAGIKLWTAESDSFGVLTSCISYENWNFLYG